MLDLDINDTFASAPKQDRPLLSQGAIAKIDRCSGRKLRLASVLRSN